MPSDLGLDRLEDGARLDDCRAGEGIDRKDAIHAGRLQDDLPGMGHRAAGNSGAPAVRHDGNGMAAAIGDDLGDLSRARRQDDDAGCQVPGVEAGVQPGHGLGIHDAGGADDPPQVGQQRVVRRGVHSSPGTP